MNKRERKRLEINNRALLAGKGNRLLPIRVRCFKKLHKIGMHNGKLYMMNHRPEEVEIDLAMSAMARTKPFRCYNILLELKKLFIKFESVNNYWTYRSKPKDIPEKLYQFMMEMRRLKFDKRAKLFPKQLYRKLPFTSAICEKAVKEAAAQSINSFTDKYHRTTVSVNPVVLLADGDRLAVDKYKCASTGEIHYSTKGSFLDITVELKHWLLRVHKQNLQCLDGYLVVAVNGCDQRADHPGCLFARVVHKTTYGYAVDIAVFHKPMERKVWWKPWQAPDRGKVWRFLKWSNR